MKKVVIALSVVLVLLLGAVFALLVQAGLFYKPVVKEGMTGPYTLAYVEYTGDYRKAGPMGMDVYNKLTAEFGVKQAKGFGIYLDDPAKVARDKCRSEVGCILEGEDIMKAPLIASKFKIKILPAKQGAFAEHPFTSPMSIMLGISKVYPLLNEFAKAKNPNPYTMIMEIYDAKGKTITYLMR